MDQSLQKDMSLAALAVQLSAWTGESAQVARAGIPSVDGLVLSDSVSLLAKVKTETSTAALDHGIALLADAVASFSHLIPVLLAPAFSPYARARCQEAGIGWCDSGGNAHIRAQGLYVHVEGLPLRLPPGPAPTYGPKASRVVRELLNAVAPQVQCALARRAGVTAGYLSKVVGRLIERELVRRLDDGRVEPTDPRRLHAAWADEYGFDKHDPIGYALPVGAGGTIDVVLRRFRSAGIKVAATGETAAHLWLGEPVVQPFKFYVERVHADRIGEMALDAAEDGGLQLALADDTGVLAHAQERGGIRCVVPVQALVDFNRPCAGPLWDGLQELAFGPRPAGGVRS